MSPSAEIADDDFVIVDAPDDPVSVSTDFVFDRAIAGVAGLLSDPSRDAVLAVLIDLIGASRGDR